MLKNYEEAKQFFKDLKQPDSKSMDIEKDEEGNKIYFGGLNRIKELLRLLGNPEDKLKIIHISGTAGKGTVAEAISHILTKNNFKVGVFTSPSLVTDIERIEINNKFISSEEFVGILNKIYPSVKYMDKHFKNSNLSAFEIYTAMAYLYFANQNVDYAVIEVGLGGKYDSTNAIKKSEISILTSVGLDHVEFLGNDIKQIAKDKASIVEKSGVLLTAVKDKELINVIEDTCKSYDSKLIVLDPSLGKNKLNIPEKIWRNYELALLAVNNLSLEIDIKNIDFLYLKLPARFETIRENPRLILDGAHNDAKITVLLEYLSLNKIDKVICIFSSFEDKDWKIMLQKLSSKIDKIIFTDVFKRDRKSIDINSMKEFASNFFVEENMFLEKNNLRAYKLAKEITKKSDTILVTGSFVHVSKIRSLFWDEEKILLLRRII